MIVKKYHTKLTAPENTSTGMAGYMLIPPGQIGLVSARCQQRWLNDFKRKRRKNYGAPIQPYVKNSSPAEGILRWRWAVAWKNKCPRRPIR
jgi:hypothetical protein